MCSPRPMIRPLGLVEPLLECQACGETLMALDPRQEQLIASDPYNYMAWCDHCTAAIAGEPRRPNWSVRGSRR